MGFKSVQGNVEEKMSERFLFALNRTENNDLKMEQRLSC